MMGIMLLAPEFAGAATDGDVSWLSWRSRVGGAFARGAWGGADLHLAATEVLIHETQTGGHVLVFRRGFSLVFSSRRLTSDSAVVWVEPADANEPNDVAIGYEIRAYLSYSRIKLPFTYWRSTHGHEVDFLIGERTAVEVKATRRVVPGDFKGLKALAEERIFADFFLVSQDEVPTRQANIRAIHWEDFLKRLWQGEIIAAG